MASRLTNTTEYLGQAWKDYTAAQTALANAFGTCFENADEEAMCSEEALGGLMRMETALNDLYRVVKAWDRAAETRAQAEVNT